MEEMKIDVISVRCAEDNYVRALVRADSAPSAMIYLQLRFSRPEGSDLRAAARDEALRYLDPN